MEFLSCDGSEDEYRLQKTIRDWVHTGAWTFAFGKNIDKKVRGVRNFPGMLWRWVTGIDSVYKLNESLSGRGSSADTVVK